METVKGEKKCQVDGFFLLIFFSSSAKMEFKLAADYSSPETVPINKFTLFIRAGCDTLPNNCPSSKVKLGSTYRYHPLVDLLQTFVICVNDTTMTTLDEDAACEKV